MGVAQTNMGHAHARVTGSVRPIKDHILVTDMEFGEKMSKGGIIILDDDTNHRGIRSRWARVHSVGHEQEDILPGQWILISHGRWTRGVEVTDPETGEKTIVRRIDSNDVFGISDTPPPADER